VAEAVAALIHRGGTVAAVRAAANAYDAAVKGADQ
jgi:hypothetical protein